MKRRHDPALVKRNWMVFARQVLRPRALALIGLASVSLAVLQDNLVPLGIIGIVALAIHVGQAFFRSVPDRFHLKRFLELWEACRSRKKSLEKGLVKLKKSRQPVVHELPGTVEEVLETLYTALRRADMIAKEIHESETDFVGRPPAVWTTPTADPQAQELHKLADAARRSYLDRLNLVQAQAQRVEGQALLFISTLDSLRVQMLQMRLTDRAVEMETQPFLESLQVAKMQLNAIDMALEELELAPWPGQVYSVPDPVEAPPVSTTQEDETSNQENRTS